ncbi:MAG: aldo/keto reductase [Haloferacaceae archaeon]
MSDETGATAADDAPTPGDVPRLDDMPMLGFGTWMLEDHEECVGAVSTALEVGYRHVDTAQAYGNEAAVGEAIERSAVDRDEIFLATKVWIDDLAHDDVIATARESLDRLRTDHVDLLYVHWPARTYDPERTLAAFDHLVAEGVTDRIGVSNFEPDQLAEACRRTEAPIFAHQFECHPLLPQRRLLDACVDDDVHPVAYSPLARGRVLDVPEVVEVAERYDATPAQVSLAWLRQRGLAAIPKATSAAHVRDNWGSLALDLDEDAVHGIDAIGEVERQVDPGFAPWR